MWHGAVAGGWWVCAEHVRVQPVQPVCVDQSAFLQSLSRLSTSLVCASLLTVLLCWLHLLSFHNTQHMTCTQIWMLILRLFAGVMVWLTIITVDLALLGCTLYAYNMAGLLSQAGQWGATIAAQLPTDADPTGWWFGARALL